MNGFDVIVRKRHNDFLEKKISDKGKEENE
jgi:hypothetical protein